MSYTSKAWHPAAPSHPSTTYRAIRVPGWHCEAKIEVVWRPNEQDWVSPDSTWQVQHHNALMPLIAMMKCQPMTFTPNGQGSISGSSAAAASCQLCNGCWIMSIQLMRFASSLRKNDSSVVHLHRSFRCTDPSLD